MGKYKKIKNAVVLTALSLGTIHVINMLEFRSATRKKIHNPENFSVYNWRFGNISYIQKGEGKPLLLLHDLMPASNSYEWNKMIDALSQSHTVYAIDLLGCGNSDKSNITYTNYMYVTLISDFVKNVIGKRTDVISTGASAPLVIITANFNDTLFDKIGFINPQNISRSALAPSTNSRMVRYLLNSPIIGTLVYNICFCRYAVVRRFRNKFFYDSTYQLTPDIIDAYYEASHLGGSTSKFLYSSIKGRFTTANISKALNSINNSIFLIAGEKENGIDTIIDEYTSVNPLIEVTKIDNCSHLPQLEAPGKVLEALKIYL